MRISVLLFVWLLTLPGAVVAQDIGKVPVMLLTDISEGDSVGRQLAFEVREAVRGASRLRLVDESHRGPRIVAWFRSGVPFSSFKDKASYFSVTIVYSSAEMSLLGALIEASLGLCGADTTVACARQILSTIDGGVDFVRKQSPDLWLTLQ